MSCIPVLSHDLPAENVLSVQRLLEDMLSLGSQFAQNEHENHRLVNTILIDDQAVEGWEEHHSLCVCCFPVAHNYTRPVY